MSKPNGSPHDPTTYKPKSPLAQEQGPKLLGVLRAHEDHAHNTRYKSKDPVPHKGIEKESRRPKAAS